MYYFCIYSFLQDLIETSGSFQTGKTMFNRPPICSVLLILYKNYVLLTVVFHGSCRGASPAISFSGFHMNFLLFVCTKIKTRKMIKLMFVRKQRLTNKAYTIEQKQKKLPVATLCYNPHVRSKRRE